MKIFKELQFKNRSGLYSCIMELFKTNKKFFMLLSIYPTSAKTNKLLKILYRLFGVFAFVILLCSLTANICFIVKYMRIDLQRTLGALFSLVGVFPSWYSLIVFHLLRKSVVGIIDEFQRMCDSSKFLTSKFRWNH